MPYTYRIGRAHPNTKRIIGGERMNDGEAQKEKLVFFHIRKREGEKD